MQTIASFRQKTPKEIKRFIKFLIVGAVGFAIDFSAFNVIHHFFNTPEVIAQTISFSAATISNFIFNYFWIYREAQDKPVVQKAGQFALVSVLGLVIGIPVFTLALLAAKKIVPALGLDTLPFNLAGNLALVCRVGVVLFWNFFANRKWTYGDIPAG